MRWTSLDPDGNPVLLGIRHALRLCRCRPFARSAFAAPDPGTAELPPVTSSRATWMATKQPIWFVADLGQHHGGRSRSRAGCLGCGVGRRITPSKRLSRASGFGGGRVADVQPSDLDADGDIDLIVADFGHFRTGNIVILKNIATAGERPRFEREVLDPRPGTIHVPPHDFNHDGLPDFVALVSQEYESVDAFINRGDGQFHLRTLWAAQV